MDRNNDIDTSKKPDFALNRNSDETNSAIKISTGEFEITMENILNNVNNNNCETTNRDADVDFIICSDSSDSESSDTESSDFEVDEVLTSITNADDAHKQFVEVLPSITDVDDAQKQFDNNEFANNVNIIDNNIHDTTTEYINRQNIALTNESEPQKDNTLIDNLTDKPTYSKIETMDYNDLLACEILYPKCLEKYAAINEADICLCGNCTN